MKTFIDLISAWPSLGAFADDAQVPYPTAAAWRQRNSIPNRYWSRVVDAARQRSIDGVSVEALASMASRRGTDIPMEASKVS